MSNANERMPTVFETKRVGDATTRVQRMCSLGLEFQARLVGTTMLVRVLGVWKGMVLKGEVEWTASPTTEEMVTDIWKLVVELECRADALEQESIGKDGVVVPLQPVNPI